MKVFTHYINKQIKISVAWETHFNCTYFQQIFMAPTFNKSTTTDLRTKIIIFLYNRNKKFLKIS